MRFLTAMIGVVVVFGVACGGGGTPDAGSPSLDCAGIRSCGAACPSSTTATCEDACIARGTSTAVAQLNALASCKQAQGCSDDACLQAKCPAQLNACLGLAPDGGGGGDGFPARYVGTVTDLNTDFAGVRLESIGTVAFVRDDAADPRGQAGFAFYKVETITYTATASGDDLGGCTWSAAETVTMTAPAAFENLLALRKVPDALGQYEYDITTTLHENRPGALTITCPPPAGTRVVDFSADNNVAAGVPNPKTADKLRLQATVPAYMQPSRTWSWDLQGMN